MANERKVAVLAAYKPFLRSLTIYNSKNFQNQDQPTLARNRREAIAISIIFFGLFVSAYANTWYVHSKNFNVAAIPVPIGLFIGVLQHMITYAFVLMKNDQVDEVLACIEQTVLKRK